MRTKHASPDTRKRAVVAYKANKQTVEAIAENFGITRNTLYRWVHQARTSKEEKKYTAKPGRGRKRILGVKEFKKLLKILKKPASKYGFSDDLWCLPRLREVIKTELDIKISTVQLWELLRESGFTYKKPEKRYASQNTALAKKWINKELPEIMEYAKKKRAVIYFEDETSLALQPAVGKTWAKEGTTPIIRVPSKRGSIPLISAISPTGKLLFSLPRTKVDSKVVIDFLKQILRHHDTRHVVVIMDSAPTHKSVKMKDFLEQQKKRLTVFYLPPYSPELNADEFVWGFLKSKKIKTHKAKNKEELRSLASKGLRSIQRKPNMIKAFCKKVGVSLFS
jgi:transposase